MESEAPVGSLKLLQSCAERHLRDFTKLGGPRSFNTYDRRGDPARFEPLDAMAPTLLDAPIRRDHVNQMWCGVSENPYQQLRVAIQECLRELAGIADQDAVALNFANVDFNDPRDPWKLVQICFNASKRTPHIKASKVSKMLHRKQPRFVPIIDSKLVRFYGLTMLQPSSYWQRLADDFRENRQFLEELCKPIMTSEGLPLSPLRAADIVIWEHVVTKCLGDCKGSTLP